MSYPISEETKKFPGTQPLKESQRMYRKYLEARLVSAANARDTNHDEFDGMSFFDNFTFNRKMANAYIPPRKNATDVNIVSGTARAKMKSIASAIVKMNLDTNVLAFDKNDDEDLRLGNVLSNILRKSKEIDGDEEKKLLRIYALLEQGTVHLGETWTPRITRRKKFKKDAQLDPATGFDGLEWEDEEIIEYECERKIYSNLEVYPGNIKEYHIEKQPYMFRRIVMDYIEAQTIFGNWKEWKYVVPGGGQMLETGADSLPYNNFRLYDLEENQVEVIYYEDLPNREYQIFINGVMMLPPRFPMPWEWDGYSMIKQVLDPINSEFYYGRSLMAELRFATEVLDRMLQMLISKTHQSIKPPSANNTGKLLGPNIFNPGQMITGVDANRIQTLINHQGVTSSEFAMYQELKTTIDMNSVNPVFQGQQPTGTATATQILEVQRQAEKSLAPIILSVSLMEEKADYLRLYNILSNWTKPIDEKIDEVSQTLVKKYRTINIGNTNVGGRMGNMKVEMIDKIPSQQERWDYSYQQLTEEKRSKTPKKKVRLILPVLQNMKYRFLLRCAPSDRASDNLNKVLFREMMEQGFNYFGPQELNMDHFKKRWAMTWGENPDDVFSNFSMQGYKDLMTMQGQLGKDIGLAGPKREEEEGEEDANMAMFGSGTPEMRKSGTGIAGGLAKASRSGGNQVIANM